MRRHSGAALLGAATIRDVILATRGRRGESLSGDSGVRLMEERKRSTSSRRDADALWSGSTKNADMRTGPLTRPFACSLAPLTCLLILDCSLRSRPPLHSLVCSLVHFAHSLACGTVNNLMAFVSVFFLFFDLSVPLNDLKNSKKAKRD